MAVQQELKAGCKSLLKGVVLVGSEPVDRMVHEGDGNIRLFASLVEEVYLRFSPQPQIPAFGLPLARRRPCGVEPGDGDVKPMSLTKDAVDSPVGVTNPVTIPLH